MQLISADRVAVDNALALKSIWYAVQIPLKVLNILISLFLPFPAHMCTKYTVDGPKRYRLKR
jgi:hypothetical protein